MKITHERIVEIAEHCFRFTYNKIIASTDIDRLTASTVAKDAADALGNALLRDLPEHGVEIEPVLSSRSWTHNICSVCWNKQHPTMPARGIRRGEPGWRPDTCCFCGEENEEGIYIRQDPATLNCVHALLRAFPRRFGAKGGAK